MRCFRHAPRARVSHPTISLRSSGWKRSTKIEKVAARGSPRLVLPLHRPSASRKPPVTDLGQEFAMTITVRFKHIRHRLLKTVAVATLVVACGMHTEPARAGLPVFDYSAFAN